MSSILPVLELPASPGLSFKVNTQTPGELGPVEQSRTEGLALNQFMKKTWCFPVVLSNARIRRDMCLPKTV